jgi:transposase
MMPKHKPPSECEKALMDDLEREVLSSFWNYLKTFVSVRQAAAVLDVTPATVYGWRRAGKLTAAPLPCGCARFAPDEVNRLAKIREEKACRAAARDFARSRRRYGQQS